MAMSDAVTGNLVTIYVAAIAAIKVVGLIWGRNFGAWFLLIVASVCVCAILVGTLTWDVSRKVTWGVLKSESSVHEGCRGGICWHGVSVRSPASQVRFRLQRNHLRN